MAEALDRRLVKGVGGDRSRGLALVLAIVLVTPVHLVSLALAAGGLALVAFGGGWWHWLIAAFLLLIAWVTRPHVFGRADPDSQLIAPDTAPTLIALIAEVALVVGARPPTEVRIINDFNAYVASRGIRGRQLALGAPMWVALEPQARIALLGHELGHLAHGDVLSSEYVNSAYRTLGRWVDLLDPVGSEVFEHDTSIMVQVLMAPPRWLVLAYLRLLVMVNSTASRRQELYADISSAIAAGTDGAVAGLEVSLIHEGLDVVANRAAMDADRPHLGEAIASRAAGYDAPQRAAARRRAASDLRSVDATHPPTVDRLRLLESVESSPAVVVLDAARNTRIDSELTESLDHAFKQLGDAYRYVH